MRIPMVRAIAAAVVVAAVVLATPGGALACPVCYGAAEGPMAHGMSLAVLTLLLFTAGVLGCFVAFFFYLVKRSRIAFEEGLTPAARLQHGGY